MAKNKIKKIYSGSELESRTRYILNNKYYNLFMNSLKFKGLTHQEEDYILRKLWSDGTICAFSMTNYGVVYCPYAVTTYGLYDVPSDLTFINERNIPNFKFGGRNGVDCCIGYYSRNHKPVREIVSYYVDRMTEILMSIYINTQTSKLPFIAQVNGDNTDSINEAISNIYNNDLAVFMSGEVMDSIKVSATGNYIIDKLWAQYLNYDSACLTELGIDNNPLSMNRITADQSNANNELINCVNRGRIYEMRAFFEEVYKLFGHRVEIESTNAMTSSIHDRKEDIKEH